VALIEHVRHLRSVEATLTSSVSDRKRADVIGQLERCRWFHREQHIDQYVYVHATVSFPRHDSIYCRK